MITTSGLWLKHGLTFIKLSMVVQYYQIYVYSGPVLDLKHIQIQIHKGLLSMQLERVSVSPDQLFECFDVIISN